MLIIRDEQMEALGLYMRRVFEERMVQHVKDAYPGRYQTLTEGGLGDKNVRALIRKGIDKAAGYGVEKEGNVTTFIEWMLEYGPDFEVQEERAWMKDILELDTWEEDGKIGAIEDLMED